MSDKKRDKSIDEWLNESAIVPEIRGYYPTSGPSEPDVPPPGRASASMPEASAAMADSVPEDQQNTSNPGQ
jgi:hypothetical protein